MSRDNIYVVGQTTLKEGEECEWVVKDRVNLYYCEALWTKYMASWNGFQKKRDSGHLSVYWRIQENGFFISWNNNSTWTKKAVWETE